MRSFGPKPKPDSKTYFKSYGAIQRCEPPSPQISYMRYDWQRHIERVPLGQGSVTFFGARAGLEMWKQPAGRVTNFHESQKGGLILVCIFDLRRGAANFFGGVVFSSTVSTVVHVLRSITTKSTKCYEVNVIYRYQPRAGRQERRGPEDADPCSRRIASSM